MAALANEYVWLCICALASLWLHVPHFSHSLAQSQPHSDNVQMCNASVPRDSSPISPHWTLPVLDPRTHVKGAFSLPPSFPGLEDMAVGHHFLILPFIVVITQEWINTEKNYDLFPSYI